MWANFEPGDATRYIVGLDYIRDADSGAFPGAKTGDVIYSFGVGSGPVQTFVFNGRVNDVSFGYYQEKMWRGPASATNLYTLVAGWLCLLHLRGASGSAGDHNALAKQIKERWETSGHSPHWRKQLDKLRQ